MRIGKSTFVKSPPSVRVAVFMVSALLALLAGGSVSAAEVVVHVAPTGDDAGDGSRANPVASLSGARDAVRRLRAEGKAGPVRVVVADGTYRVAEPLVLTPEDGGSAEAPVRYEAAPGAKPVFSGGRKITGFRAGENGLWVADVPEVAAGQWYFEQLWAGGRRARRAMEPDTGQFFFETEPVETNLGGGRFRQTSTVSQEVILLLTGLSQAQRSEVKLMVFHNWNHTHRFISAIDADRRTISTEGPQALRSYSQWKQGHWGGEGYFHLENFLSALDEPGEWFLARDGKLYYRPRPGEDPASMEFVAPVTSQFLQIQGDPAGGRFVQHVQFRGLAFNHGQWLTSAGGYGPAQAAQNIEAAVMLDGARNVMFQDCEIAHTGIYGLWFRRGCSQCSVERCLFRDLGAGGVRVGEQGIQSNTAERTHHITLDNNIIQSGGRIFADAVGVWIGQSGDNTVTHNDIGDFYYSAVSVGWTWGYGNSLASRNNISYNHLHHLGQRRMSDLAGVYSLGISDGTVISHNVIHDVYCWGYGGWGLYPDEGSSSILFENNLVYDVSDGGFHQHYGRDNTVRNNILAFSQEGQVALANVTNSSFTFERNIVYFDQGQLLGKSYNGWFGMPTVTVRSNIYWRARGQSFNFAGRSWDQWRARYGDEGSIIADPKFMDPEKRDFRCASDEVIKRTGFQPFDYSQTGVYGDAGWIALAAFDGITTTRLVPARSTWKYNDTGVNLGEAWRAPAYDDSAWPEGPAQLGFGDGDEATFINTNRLRITTYFRKTFVVPPQSVLMGLTVRLLRDDGGVIFLNGTEVFRSNMPTNRPIYWDTQALGTALPADESTQFYEQAVGLALLRPGTNTLAVEMHQYGTNSSDLSFDLELVGTNLVVPNNTPPVVSSIGAVTIAEDTATDPIFFTVWDRESWAEGLQVSAYSSNPLLTPSNSFFFGGSGSNRFLIITPAADQNGSATIELLVWDGFTNVITTCNLLVTPVPDAPQIALAGLTPGSLLSRSSLVLTGSVYEPDGDAVSVDFFANGLEIGRVTNAPYAINWSNAVAGYYQLQARATDATGLSATSAPVFVTVLGDMTLAATGAVWKYHDQGQNLGSAWTSVNYPDQAWMSGPGPLGYGDANGVWPATTNQYGPSSTAKYITTYYRHRFALSNATSLTNLSLRLQRDDGAIVYLNGVEVFRTDMPTGLVTYTTLATNTIGGAGELTWLTAALDASLLREGTNLLAAEVHQVRADSSDIFLNLELKADQTLQPPALWAIPDSGAGMKFAWPAWAAGLSLWGATNLTPPVTWAPITNAMVITNGEATVLVPLEIEARFFQLRSP